MLNTLKKLLNLIKLCLSKIKVSAYRVYLEQAYYNTEIIFKCVCVVVMCMIFYFRGYDGALYIHYF